MKKLSFFTLPDFLLLLILVAFSAYALSGVSSVPFHPDESTQIYMSADLPTYFSNPVQLSWEPGLENDPRTRYRLLDAPLTRLLIGVGRAALGQPAQPADWDWSATWSQNENTGAMPSPGSLVAARTALTLLLPATLLCIFLAVRRLLGSWAALAAAVFLAIHPLTLLHARRAMAEGPLLIGICLFLFALTRPRPTAWLLGLAIAVAFNAKQSTAALIPAAFLAILLSARRVPKPVREIASQTAVFSGVLLSITLVLNPVLWKYPLQAGFQMLNARQELLASQTADFREIAPQLVLDSPVERGVVLIAQLFIAPPSFAETGNYRIETGPAEANYKSRLFESGLPGRPLSGFILLILAIFGAAVTLLDLRHAGAGGRVARVLLLSAGFFQFTALIYSVPLAFQRYAVPLLPFACVFTIVGGQKIIWLINKAVLSRRN